MPEAMTVEQIDQTIEQVETLYRSVTGEDAPAVGESAYAPIPAEKDPSRHLEEQIDRLLAALGAPAPTTLAAAPWTPPMSVCEGDGEVVVLLDLPGVTRERVEVSVQGNALIVSGQRALPSPERLRLRMNERALGPFRRTLLVPVGLRTAEAAAHMREGVLEIKIPREPSAAPSTKKVPVN